MKAYRENQMFHGFKTEEPIVDLSKFRRLICYVHIPKAGGTSLKNLMLYNFRNSYQDWHPRLNKINEDQEKLSRLHAVSAHRAYGYHRALRAAARGFDLDLSVYDDPVCVSIVRDPVDRFVSTYNFVISFRPHALHQACKDMEFEEFHQYFKENRPLESHNLQCAFLTGSKTGDANAAIEAMSKNFEKVVSLKNEKGLRDYFKENHNLEVPEEAGHLNKSVKTISRKDISKKKMQEMEADFAEDQRLYDFILEQEAKVPV